MSNISNDEYDENGLKALASANNKAMREIVNITANIDENFKVDFFMSVLGNDINSLRTDFVDRLFSQNVKLCKPTNVVNPHYTETMWVVSKGPTLFLRHQKANPSVSYAWVHFKPSTTQYAFRNINLGTMTHLHCRPELADEELLV